MNKWTRRLTVLMGISFLGLTACQKQEMDPLKAQYQDFAGQAVAKYTKTVSSAVQLSMNNRSQSRGFVSGGWDPFGGMIYGGGSVISNSIDAETQRCVSMVQQIPRQSQYFYLRLGTLARCMDVVINYRNPLMTYGYRNLDPFAQNYWGYNLNYARPTTFGGQYGGDYQSWNFYAGAGFYPGQVPNYTVPGFGF